MSSPGTMAAPARRRHLRRTFDARVDEEWSRYAGEPRRVLVRELRERFVRLHVPVRRGLLLELGPGPGRFTPELLRRSTGRVVSIDLSRSVLRRARRRNRGADARRRVDWLQAAGEELPLADRSVDGAVLLGNIVCFAARDGPVLLQEVARVVKPGGILIADFASAGAATQEFLDRFATRRALRRILRRPRYYLIDAVLSSGDQPYLPRRLATWEFRFYTADEARRALEAAGFRARDVMAVGPVSWGLGHVARSAARERRTWENLLRIEERLGRRAGLLETGHGFVIAATRTSKGRTRDPPRSRRRP